MAAVSIARACFSGVLGLCALTAALAQPAAPALAPLAHSALLTVDAAPRAGGLALRVRRASGEAPLVVNELAVRIDNKSEPATANPDGSWFVPRPATAVDAGKTIEVTVGHDGVHEVLSGRLAPAAGTGSGAPGSGTASVISSSHKQIFWWILNIAIVAIAAIAISRRTS
ncbi:MAG TPA: hypothetical protein VE819_03970 [Steroidobacteraceae bacterium]|jgi:hypothetical protein|nr:hypothetical protein [Steroidobacteraceae bacterium]